MSIQDPIADMLTRIRNAQMVSKSSVSMSHSKAKVAVADVLKQEGYILGYESGTSETGHPSLIVNLKYFEGRPVIRHMSRVSRPSLRIYKQQADLPRVENGLGIAIVSTSKGVMTARQARKQGLGGEVMCVVS